MLNFLPPCSALPTMARLGTLTDAASTAALKVTLAMRPSSINSIPSIETPGGRFSAASVKGCREIRPSRHPNSKFRRPPTHQVNRGSSGFEGELRWLNHSQKRPRRREIVEGRTAALESFRRQGGSVPHFSSVDFGYTRNLISSQSQ